MINTLNTKNGPLVNLVYDFLLNFNILVWRKNNAGRTHKQIGLFKFLGIKGKIYKIHLLSNPIKFRGTIIKPYLINNNNTKNYSPSTTNFWPLTQNLLPDTAALPANKILSTPITRSFQV